MRPRKPAPQSNKRVDTIVIGTGIGGLAATLQLADAGQDVLALEKAATPGGKLRTMDSVAGPVDAGPTVFTLRPLFEALFRDVGEDLEDHLDLVQEPIIARHWWPDGESLDLHADFSQSLAAVRDFAGDGAAREFANFCDDAQHLFHGFAAPVMYADAPRLGPIVSACLKDLSLLRHVFPPRTLWQTLGQKFSDPRLRQLFARYATYVGGSPFESPGLLMLIFQAEAQGVSHIRGGMAALPRAIAALAERRGAEIRCNEGVARIERDGDGLIVHTESGAMHRAKAVVFNGDPNALATGLLGPDMNGAVKRSGVQPRALSAYVWSFAATPSGARLQHHNVFFNRHYRREFSAIRRGRMPDEATLYVCAQDRGLGLSPHGAERFEIIMNGPPVNGAAPSANHPARDEDDEEFQACQIQTFETLSRMGLDFDPWPGRAALTTPQDFAALFPGSAGSLYGRSPHGTRASFQRPVTRTPIPGLYLAGGGVHPGAGLPMALTSGRHAAAAILTDHASISRSRPTATRGGMSTDFPMTENAVSRSSGS